jgi:hypothetical protein
MKILILACVLLCGCVTYQLPPTLPVEEGSSYSPLGSAARMSSFVFLADQPTNGYYISTIAIGTNGPFVVPDPINQGINLTSDGQGIAIVAWVTNSLAWLQSTTNLAASNWVNEIKLTNGVSIWVDPKMKSSNRVYRLLFIQ